MILSKNKVLYFAHRGITIRSHENTIGAFNDAYKFEVDGIECDIQITSDNIIIIYHDNTILINNEIVDISQSTLYALNEKICKSKDHSIKKIIQIEDLLKDLPDNIFINLEIKSQKALSYGIEERLYRLVEKYKIQSRVMVSSFNPFILRRIKKIDASIFTAYLIGDYYISNIFNSRLINSIRYLVGTLYCKPDAINPEINYLNYTMCNLAKKYSVAIFPYTINTDAELNKALSMGVNGIFSDNVDFIKRCN
tara:strand:- start:1146 stop:1901 length:756 start_codon:yes stop_codon:yes gene_type:complete